jgi:capsule polysaccharide export protein KpsE/RkpR
MSIILQDFIKIRNHLDLSDKLSLEIQFHHSEGFHFSMQNRVMIGIKDGYWRRLLIHECLHVAGLMHYDVPGYESAINHDIHSEAIEHDIFGEVRVNVPLSKLLES